MKIMEKEFLPYDLAVRMRDLGFDEEYLAYYTSNWCNDIVLFSIDEINYNNNEFRVPAPLFQQAFKFFIYKNNIQHEIKYKNFTYNAFVNNYYLGSFKSYEEAELACIIALIEFSEKIK